MGIGANLKNILNKKNMTVADLSKLSGIPKTTLYSMIKRDGENEKHETLKLLCASLDIIMDELLGYEKTTISTNVINARHSSGLEILDMSHRTGIPIDRYISLELGYNLPTSDELQIISEISGVSVDELNTAKTPDKSDSEQLEQALLLNVRSALAHAPRDDKKREEAYITRLSHIVQTYGAMSQHTYVMALSSRERPNEYIKFIQNYERLLRLVHEHKEDVISGAFNYLDDDSKLRALIYGDEPDQK